MTTGVHDAGSGHGRNVGASSGRGFAVIIAAVVVGLLLMWRGLGERETIAAEADASAEETTAEESTSTDATADEATTDTTTADATTETTAAPVAHDPAEVKVLVLNGTNGVKGVAGRGVDAMTAAGFQTGTPENADVDGPSLILYVEGYEADAIAVAEVFGVDPALVVQPFDAATSPIADTQSANVIVRVGNDGLIQI